MQLSTVSESAPRFRTAYVEAFKWIGLAAMLVQHFALYAFQERAAWIHITSRVSFPLFTFALALGLADKKLFELRGTVKKLALWGVVAGVVGLVVRPIIPGNILFTFALGITLHACLRSYGAGSLLVATACVVASFFVEYSVQGVVAVALAMHGARQEDAAKQGAWFFGSLCLIALYPANWPALATVPVFFAVMVLDLQWPRVRGFFYGAYVVQWPLIAGVAWIVG